jgi:ribonuclease R
MARRLKGPPRHIQKRLEREQRQGGRFRERKADAIVGIFRRDARGQGRIVPVDRKAMGRDWHVEAIAENGALEGELVSADLVSSGRIGLQRAVIRERLGTPGSERSISMIAIHTHDIPHVFARECLDEAEAARPAKLGKRDDWRDLPLVTIDPADARDHDDAVHAAPDPDPANKGGFVLSIAIADVAAYVLPGSAMDQEAEQRGNSVYFPDRVVPMLPERISNDLCSLRPDEDRAALAVQIVIAADGTKKAHAFHRILMRSAAKLSYQQAQAIADGAVEGQSERLATDIIAPLFAAYRALQRARDRRQPLDLDLPERRVALDSTGQVEGVVTPERLDAHRLIEEFMVLANVCAAETLEEHKQPLLYRIHDEPSLAKMESLREFAKSLDLALPRSGALKPSLFNHLLSQLQGTDHAFIGNEMVLRSQAQAQYSPDNCGHFGLALRRYAHFTSPIRRYADLIVHRALIRALRLGEGALPDTPVERLRVLGDDISKAERRAMAAERETIERLVAAHLAERVGESFEARVSGISRGGLFVRLDSLGADGFVQASTLGADYFRQDEALRALIGVRTGEAYRMGDPVRVKLVEASPEAGALRFEVLSGGRFLSSGEGRRAGRRASGSIKASMREKRREADGSPKGKESRGRTSRKRT